MTSIDNVSYLQAIAKFRMFDEMPERYTVFIVEDDMFGKS